VFFSEYYISHPKPSGKECWAYNDWEDATDATANTDGTAIERADGTANTGVN